MLLKILLAFFSSVLGCVIVELGARVFLGAPIWIDQRVVFFSSQTWKQDPMGAMRYTPDSELRTVAIYGNKVEYDISYRTNNLGFIDRVDYANEASKRGKEGIVFVGDSLTAGFHGNDPWVPRLRDQVQQLRPEIEIYNLGIGAIGTDNFTRLLKSVEDELEFQKIVFLLITDDLNRLEWLPFEREGNLYLCTKGQAYETCLSQPSRMLLLNNNDQTVDEMRAVMREKGLVRPTQGILDWWTKQSFIGARLRPIPIGRLVDLTQKPRPKRWARYFANWLLELKTEFGHKEIVVVHLPRLREIRAKEFVFDAASLAQSAGIEYISLLEVCNLRVSDYFKYDLHPNRKGYQKIRKCVGTALGLIENPI